MTTTRKENNEVPASCGIYFYWLKGRVEYVGQSVNLRARLGPRHERIPNGGRVSFLTFERRLLSWAECYYIGTLQPSLNFGGRAAHNRYDG